MMMMMTDNINPAFWGVLCLKRSEGGQAEGICTSQPAPWTQVPVTLVAVVTEGLALQVKIAFVNV